MPTTEPSTTPERELADYTPSRQFPDEFDTAITRLKDAACDFCLHAADTHSARARQREIAGREAEDHLRHVIAAALAEAKDAGKQEVLDDQYEEGRSHDYE